MPKFSDLSPAVQIVVILAIAAAVWGVSEYMVVRPVDAENQQKRLQKQTLEGQVAPLRPYREKVRALEADNKQLENQLANLRRIVPNENEVDNFVRLLHGEANTAGIALRRFTAKPPVQQQYYIEVPFEMELDGSYYDVLRFYERLGRVERITNVSDLKMDGLQGATAGRKYPYAPNETVTAVCTVTTFFSTEEEPAAQQTAANAPAGAQAQQGRAAARAAVPGATQ